MKALTGMFLEVLPWRALDLNSLQHNSKRVDVAEISLEECVAALFLHLSLSCSQLCTERLQCMPQKLQSSS